MPYWLTFIAKPTGHLDTFLVPINERQMALVVATLLIDDAGTYYTQLFQSWAEITTSSQKQNGLQDGQTPCYFP